MKFGSGKCSGECIVCGANSCHMEDTSNSFARANKEQLIERLHSDSCSEADKHAIRVWLKIQFDYEE